MNGERTADEDLEKTVVPKGPLHPPVEIPAALLGMNTPLFEAGTATSRTGASTSTRTSGFDVTGKTTNQGTGASLGRSESRLRTEAEAVIASALAEEEGARAHGFSAIIAAITALTAGSLLFLGGHPVARALAIVALTLMAAGSAYVYRRTRDPSRYTWKLHRAYGMLIATGVGFVEYHLGMFSPLPVALTLGVVFIGQSSDRVGSIAIPVYVIVRWSLVALLVAFGVLPDLGLFAADAAELSSKVFGVLAVATVLTMTLRLARLNRASVSEALEKSREAILVAHERAAQLEEAKQNLDRALRAVVGKSGRYTGSTAGRYRLDEIIGVGAMGEVYAAVGGPADDAVAVKLMQAETAGQDDLVERFIREGEICVRLRSPHVVRVLEVGRMQDGAPYLAMERLYGDDLATRLRRDGHLELEEAAVLAREIALGLDEAHALGVVHRDLKPQNLFHAETRDGERIWKILDFGVSKLADNTHTLTKHEAIGTPGYMSPEQARGLKVDPRSDLFSMAVVLYRVVTGQPAFNGANAPEKLFEIVYRMPEAPTKLRPELPSDLDHVFAIALSKDPEHRFESATALAKAFVRASRRELPRGMRDRGHAAQKRLPWGTFTASRPSGG